MNEITNWSEVFLHSFQTFGQKLLSAVSGMLGALFILLLGWFIARLIARGVTRLLRLVKFDSLAKKLRADELLEKANIRHSPSKLMGTFVYWILLLLVIISASDALGWMVVSQEVSKLLGLLPNVLVAIVLFVVGFRIASFARDFIQGAASSMNIDTGKIIGSIVFYLLLILITLTALNQAGVDTGIITNNLMLILGAALATAAISYGLASKDVLANILAGFYSRRTFHTGQVVEVDGVRGEIVAENNISLTLKSANGEFTVVPAHKFITLKVKVLSPAMDKDKA
ncbi:MAG TPA: mechanosensitive ion channel [Bacteroidetes bacterium]|nr:mechanosensitive ion channel [Bacteroidota bacterium]